MRQLEEWPVRRVLVAVLMALALAAGIGGTRSVEAATAPNDNFASATAITSLPFDDPMPPAAFDATAEPGEPAACQYAPAPLASSVWYTYTPVQNVVVELTPGPATLDTAAVAYTGPKLADLQAVACSNTGFTVTFTAYAGTTYYIQIASTSNRTDLSIHMQEAVLAPPVSSFYIDPAAPSVFSTVNFYNACYDPYGYGFKSWSWIFGDGSTSTEANAAHQYKSDADYTISLTCTTNDDRTATSSQVVHVATHDVAITKFTVPTSASAGQTRQITVSLKNTRYPENVRVELFRINAAGESLVGSLMQTVPVRPANRTTAFTFIYTFTKDDAAAGKVTFKALAWLTDATDALPADNLAVAPPTKVTYK